MLDVCGDSLSFPNDQLGYLRLYLPSPKETAVGSRWRPRPLFHAAESAEPVLAAKAMGMGMEVEEALTRHIWTTRSRRI